MRIAQVSTVSAPVRHATAGSVESLVWLLTRELVRLGHEVTVFGTAGSECDGKLVATLPGSYGAKGTFDDWQLCEWVNLARALERSSEFDIIHTHAYLWGLPLERMSPGAMVHTLHIVPDDNNRSGDTYNKSSRPASRSRPTWRATSGILHAIDVRCREPPVRGDRLARFLSLASVRP